VETTDENVSNITRLASINAALSMFQERPLLGVGFGQFGFNYPRHLEADDFRSYEVRDYVESTYALSWPPAYSIHARLLAETGIMGYAVWIGFILVFLFRSLRHAARANTGGSLHLGIAMTLCGWLLLGTSIDSFRFFGGWIAMGVALGLAPPGSSPRANSPEAARNGSALLPPAV
jgi:O-antigen ligase